MNKIRFTPAEAQVLEYATPAGEVLFEMEFIVIDQILGEAMKANPSDFLPSFTDLLRKATGYEGLTLTEAFQIATTTTRVMDELKKRIESQLTSLTTTTSTPTI